MSNEEEMVWVPRKPTQAMLEAAWADALAENAVGVWESMIEAWLKEAGRVQELKL